MPTTDEARRERFRKDKQRQRKSTRQWYLELIKNRFCEICGEKDPVTFDWHHKDPSQKEETVSYMLRNRGKTAILNELEKCQCLCANCHRKVHRGLKSGT